MVDEDLIRDNPLARQAVAMLHHSGVLDEQKTRLLEQLVAGDPDESDEYLNKRIREFRLRLTAIESMRELGEQLTQKQEDE